MAQMKPVWWMAGLSVLSAVMASAALPSLALPPAPRNYDAEIWLGMLAPLVVVSASWIVAARTYTRRPEQLTSVMIMAFAGKLALFGAYFGFAIGVLHLHAVPFVASFAVYFISLHMAEALCLHRMFAERMQAA